MIKKINNLKSLLVAVVLFGCISASATPNWYTYRVQVPNHVSCVEDAKTMALVLSQALKQSSIYADCIGTTKVQNFDENIIVVHYQAEFEQIPYRGVIGGGVSSGIPTTDSGIYAEYKDCLADIENQQTHFGKSTLLAPFASYCVLANPQYGEGYSIVNEGFGTPTTRVFSFADTNYMNEAPIYLQILTEINADITFHDQRHVLYYSAKGSSIERFAYGLFANDVVACQEQTEMSREILIKSGATVAKAFCVEDTQNKDGELKLYHLNGYSITAGSFAGQEVPNKIIYNSYNDCKSDIQRVLQNYASGHLNPLGALCLQDLMNANNYKITVYLND